MRDGLGAEPVPLRLRFSNLIHTKVNGTISTDEIDNRNDEKRGFTKVEMIDCNECRCPCNYCLDTGCFEIKQHKWYY